MQNMGMGNNVPPGSSARDMHASPPQSYKKLQVTPRCLYTHPWLSI